MTTIDEILEQEEHSPTRSLNSRAVIETSDQRRPAGVETLFTAAENAWRQRDVQALTTLYDFPIYVGTDDSAGVYQGGEWDAEQFRAAMTAMMNIDPGNVSRRDTRTPHFLSDSIAMVVVETSLTVGAREQAPYTSAVLVIKKGNEWRFKSGVEAGHGKPMECPIA